MMLIDKIKQKLSGGGDQRTANVIRNTMMSAAMRVASLACSLVMVPVTIHYLNTENYGIWMAISSIIYWFTFFDVGLGNGMRNYLARALSKGDYASARSYFSTAMYLLSAISAVIGLIVLPVVYSFNLADFFNTQCIENRQLADALAVAVVFSLIQFVVKNIGMVYIAMQKYAVNDLIVFLGNILSLAIIYILTRTTEGNLLYVVAACTAVPVMMFCIASIPLLRKYPQLTPSIKAIDLQTARQIVGKGLGFFIIQITSCLIVFGSTNVLISHFCGPEQVTVYNVAYKLFNVLVIGFTILISPLWNAYTDAAVKNDYEWIRRSFVKSLRMLLIVTAGGVVMLAVSPWFFEWWVGDSVQIPFEVALCVLLYVSSFNYANCTAYLLNGMNILRVHVITAVSVSAVYLLVVSTMGYELGVAGIVSCMAGAYLVMGSVYLYQCHLVIERKNTGIWRR